jgi:hypothetical protein
MTFAANVGPLPYCKRPGKYIYRGELEKEKISLPQTNVKRVIDERSNEFGSRQGAAVGGTGAGLRGERAEPAGLLRPARDRAEHVALLAPAAEGGWR